MRSVTAGEPRPDRIVLDVGTGFAVGALGGSIFHFIKGLRASPSGARIVGGVQAVRMNAPRIGGSFAAWAALFSSFSCAAVYVRQKQDPWNSIVAGATTGGLLSARRGLGAATRSAVFSSSLFALVEGMNSRFLAQAEQAQQNLPSVQDPNLLAIANRIQAAQHNLPKSTNPEETNKTNDNRGEI